MITSDSPDVRRELQEVQGRLAELTAEARRLEAEHDELLLRLADNEGLSDKRPAGVR